MSREARLYLEDMRDCCGKIMRYCRGMKKGTLMADNKTYDAVMRNLEITGEAARQLPQNLKDRHPEVQWRAISGFRDVAIHGYPTIDEDIVWDIVENKVPELLGRIESILATEFHDAS